MSPSLGPGGSVNLKPVIDRLERIEETQIRHGELLEKLVEQGEQTQELLMKMDEVLTDMAPRLDSVETNLKDKSLTAS